MDPCFQTATRLARAIRNGRLSSVDATEAHLKRILQLAKRRECCVKRDLLEDIVGAHGLTELDGRPPPGCER